eukprot:434595-Rhodomonas_salina.1
MGGTTIGNTFSVMLWVYFEEYTGNNGCLVTFSVGDGFDDLVWHFGTLSGSPRNSLFLADGTTRYYSYMGQNLVVPLNQWAHVAWTVSGRTATAYVNGVQDWQVTMSRVIETVYRSKTAIAKSANPANENNHWLRARVSDFRVYDVTLSATEVNDITLGVSLYCAHVIDIGDIIAITDNIACKCDKGFQVAEHNTSQCIIHPAGAACHNWTIFPCETDHTIAAPRSDGYTDCVCRPGYYAETFPTSHCLSCEAGHTCQGNMSHVPCPDNSASGPLSSHVSDCICNAGYYAETSGNCTLCPANSWCWGGVKNDCPANFVSEPGLSWPQNCTVLRCGGYDFAPNMYAGNAHNVFNDNPLAMDKYAIELGGQDTPDGLLTGSVTIGGDITVVMWVYMISYTQANTRFVEFTNAEGNIDSLMLDSGSLGSQPHLRAFLTNGGGYLGVTTESIAFPLQTWVHIGISVQFKTLNVYINGNVVSTKALSAVWQTTTRTLTAFGRSPFDTSNRLVTTLHGRMSDIRVYDRALSTTEVNSIANTENLFCDYAVVFAGLGLQNPSDFCPRDHWCAMGVTNACPLHAQSEPHSAKQQDCTCSSGYYGPAGGLCQECTVDHWCPGGGEIFNCPNNSFSLHMGANASTDCICDPGFHQTNTTATGP